VAWHCPSRALLLKLAAGTLLACRVNLMPVDVHAHYVPHRILATLEERARDFGVSLVKTPPQCALHFDYGLKVRPFFAKLIEPVAQRLDGMSAQGVSCQLLSVWPDIFAYGLPSPIAARWHRLMNESLSELCHSYPGRFALFASVPLPDAAAAVREAEFAMRQLGAAGLVVAANVEGVNLGELDLDEFWQSAVSLDAPIFIHPVQAMPAPRTSKFGLVQIAQYTFDTTLCVGSLIFSGVLDRFPRLRIILAHGGGTFPYLLGRFDCLHVRMDREAQGTSPKRHHRPMSAASTTTRSCTVRCICAGSRRRSASSACCWAATTRFRPPISIRSARCGEPASPTRRWQRFSTIMPAN
jgi:aminocarboxymuconate-semialdehyde decarboxylase